ncbi:hypothetical protein [Larkinella soli]|uniref:hypothetical protein n=1 Tax=Larkinella soli TaxID=1770527 RepID=UPI000FFB6C50|nr:hypothetical protein [Larkinella soli]
MFSGKKRQAVNGLRVVSLGYLMLPSLLFLATWVRPAAGSVCIGLLLASAILLLRNGTRFSDASYPALTPRNLTGVGLLTLGLSVAFGMGEFTRQVLDFHTNNYKYYDLAQLEWPVFYRDYQAYLCYYIAYYLPVSWVCKFVGLEWGRYLSLGWSWLGIGLAFAWVLPFAGRKPWLFLVLLLLFSDSWIFIKMLRMADLAGPYLPPNYIDIHGFRLFAYAPYNDQIAWAPQHLIPALIAGMYLTFLNLNRARWWGVEVALLMGSCVLWSPLAVIGCLPFVLFLLWKYRVSLLHDGFQLLVMAVVTAGFLPVLSYLVSTDAMSIASTNMFIWETGEPSWPLYYLFFVGANFAVWIPLVLGADRAVRPWFWVAQASLALLPLYRIGVYNDLLTRGSVPAVSVVAVLVVRQLIEFKNHRRGLYGLFVVFFAVNALSPLRFFTRLFPFTPPDNTIEHPFLLGSGNTLDYLAKQYGGPTAARQYILKKDSGFERYFLRQTGRGAGVTSAPPYSRPSSSVRSAPADPAGAAPLPR